MSSYKERLKLVRAGAPGGAQDPDTGVWTQNPGGSAVVYDGTCDAQDKGKVLTRDAQGNVMVASDITIFLPSKGLVGKLGVQQDDLATITWLDGVVTTGQVLRADRLDDSIYLRRA